MFKDGLEVYNKDKTYVQLGIFGVEFYEGIELEKNSKIWSEHTRVDVKYKIKKD